MALPNFRSRDAWRLLSSYISDSFAIPFDTFVFWYIIHN